MKYMRKVGVTFVEGLSKANTQTASTVIFRSMQEEFVTNRFRAIFFHG